LALRPGVETPPVEFVDELPQTALLAPIGEGQPQLQALVPGRVRVLADMDPLGAADELGDLAAGPSQRFGDLDAAGAAADDAPAFAGIGHAVIPARRVKSRSGETLAARYVGIERPVQKAGGAHEDFGNIAVARGGLDVPAAGG